MAFLPGIFGNRNPQQQNTQPQVQHPNNPAQNQQGQQGQGGQQGTPQNSNGSGGPAGSQQNPANSNINPANPLDPFMQLMTPKEGQESNQGDANQGLFGGLNADAINAQAKKANFASGVDPALAQKALSGDMDAFLQVINTVGQNAFASSVQMSQGLVEHGVKTGTERFSSGLDSRFRDYNLRQQTSSNPALQHPVGKALLSSVQQQIAQANPRMNPQEVHAKAEEMFQSFANMLVAKPEGEGGSKGKKETDWTSFLEESQGN